MSRYQKGKTRKVKTNLDLLEQEIVSGSGRGRLELEDIISVLQRNRLRWYGHVLRKEDNDWVKKCMEYKVEGTRTRGRPKKTWR